MRRPSSYLSRGEELDVTMTPLIDVVFLLLVFFLWTASFQLVEQMLPSRLTAVAGAAPSLRDEPPPPEEDFDRVVVRVRWHDGQPSWQINDTVVDSLAEVQRRLQDIAAIKRDAPVILHPAQEVPVGHVIDLYDVTRLLGFERIQFAASQPI
ncbi:MAG: biopolymer transporter ExbD [Pirellulaceae bacterium]|jgi:biopolymer transport protein ExbD|nr:biopolymer transporter ExbD [Pirellulaceae bacterium]